MLDEITHTLERLRDQLEALAVRGIRAAGPDQVALLKRAGEEFDQVGAAHLAGRIGDLVAAMQGDNGTAAAALLRTQTSLRLFDRVLTLEVAQELLEDLTRNDELDETFEDDRDAGGDPDDGEEP